MSKLNQFNPTPIASYGFTEYNYSVISQFINPTKPAIVLAPMDGVTDAPLRALLTRTGYYDYCVSEFVRVSETVLSPKNFRKHVPELQYSGGLRAKTSASIPVLVQLLGGDPERLAQSALNAVEAGAEGIDLNFGCPAPTVNRHDGGATLLKYPHRIETIVRAVRNLLPSHVTVSAKLRLGFDDPEVIYENAKRAEQGGANWITIHGRTKIQGYTPPAYWRPIGKVKQALSIPVIANGEIWSLADFKECQQQTECIHFMLGRGALAFPRLAGEIRQHLGLQEIPVQNKILLPIDVEAQSWAGVFEEYNSEAKRIKQWTRYLAHKRKVEWWETIKTAQSTSEILNRLKQAEWAKTLVVPAEAHQPQTAFSL